MPAALNSGDGSTLSTTTTTTTTTTFTHPNRRTSNEIARRSSEQATSVVDGYGMNGNVKEGIGGRDGSVLSVPNNANGSERAPSAKSLALSMKSRRSASNLTVGENERRSGEGYREHTNGKPMGPPRSPLSKPVNLTNGEANTTPARSVSHGGMIPMAPNSTLPPVEESSPRIDQTDGMLKPPTHGHHHHRASSPPAFTGNGASTALPRPDRLTHRHTLEVPKVNTRTSTDGHPSGTGLDGQALSATGRFSPNSPTRRRASLQLTRRATRSLHSDMHLDDVPQDEDAARWTEHIRAKRASRKHRVDTDDDRVVVGTKVDENHVNYVTAYNMLTGIRFTVSRCNAKPLRELTEADFIAKHKMSFDITGNELTPSAKYDFKFKDYAPWVFRHLRAIFKIDPAEYLMSLTSKYILSELGSPGKSGSFFYFSRDYKYIIKTIHHGEHKFLRKILKDYYQHAIDNPNTLLSQFYGLHRVKIPYGRKIHFVVMNNLFPPHRDIHRTFDLKGSTIGRDFREEDLETNPRATLKDLNWLRRNLHLEFGPTKKEAFVEQMQKDVQLLQRLKIMDYSLLVGIHDLERGNEEMLRDKTLQVFQPGGDKQDDQGPSARGLMRTPSRMENAKRARELREMVKKERPKPMDQTLDKMPEESHKSSFFFYADDGGFRATHEDDRPGEEIYYLGIIDCLTRYNYIKKAEHFWKGMGGHESQISPIPPERYGDRFIKFISGITMSRERAERERISATLEAAGANIVIPDGIEGTINDPQLGGVNIHNIHQDPLNPPGTEKVMGEAEHQAEKSRRRGSGEVDVPERSLGTVKGDQNATLPIIGEAAESASNNSRTPSRRITPEPSREDVNAQRPIIGNAGMTSENIGEVPPPTPPKMDGSLDRRSLEERLSWGGHPPPTPPKDERRGRLEKDLPLMPQATTQLSASPSRIGTAS